MSGYEQVRSWKDLDERGDAAHPSGEIDLASLSGGAAAGQAEGTFRLSTFGCCGQSFDYSCPFTQSPTCPIPPRPLP
jgi:hypothetical protein